MIECVLTTIRERYHEPLSLDELARVAFVSKFHLLRTFRQHTGVTPGRFLAAVRLQEAKRMLHDTSRTVADISIQVGYSSLGSFTHRFTNAVGLSPIQYRRMSRGGSCDRPRVTGTRHAREGGVVHGTVLASESVESPIFVGAFDSRILQGQPVAATVIGGPGPFRITGVPVGTWFFHSVALDTDSPGRIQPEPLLTGTTGPLTQQRSAERSLGDLTIRPREWTDPPILFALLGLDTEAIHEMVEAS